MTSIYQKYKEHRTLDNFFQEKKEITIIPSPNIPEDKKPSSEVKERRKNQKELIMELLAEHDSIPIWVLVRKGVYQYNARISELNRELAEHNKEIVSVEVDGVCCKRLEVMQNE
jgi:hypothetical protein